MGGASFLKLNLLICINVLNRNKKKKPKCVFWTFSIHSFHMLWSQSAQNVKINWWITNTVFSPLMSPLNNKSNRFSVTLR